MKNAKAWIPFQTFRGNRENLECVPSFLAFITGLLYNISKR